MLERLSSASDRTRYRQQGVPIQEIGAEIHAAWAGRAADAPLQSAQATPREPWLNKEWQETHSFTALIEALRELDRLALNSPRAWQARAAWEAVVGVSELVRRISGWTDHRWEAIYHAGLDHWLRPKYGKRTEAKMLRARFSRQLRLLDQPEDDP